MKPDIEKIWPDAVEAEIGRGGMGVVYREIDTRLTRAVAIEARPGLRTLNLLIGFDRDVDGVE